MNNYTKLLAAAFITVVGLIAFLSQPVYAHCQVPCGIYDDNARVKSMLEDAETVEKADNEIAKLAAKSDAKAKNQLVRWITNKEKHAQNIISTISDYFLTQRVKPDQKDYVERLKKHHAVIIAAMKAKQNTDIKYAEKLKECIKSLLVYYPEQTKEK